MRRFNNLIRTNFLEKDLLASHPLSVYLNAPLKLIALNIFFRIRTYEKIFCTYQQTGIKLNKMLTRSLNVRERNKHAN